MADASNISFRLERGFGAYSASVAIEGLSCVDADANVFLGGQTLAGSTFSGCKSPFFSSTLNSTFFEAHKQGSPLLLRMVEPAGTVTMTVDNAVAPLPIEGLQQRQGGAVPRDGELYQVIRGVAYEVLVDVDLGTNAWLNVEFNGPAGAEFVTASIEADANAIVFTLDDNNPGAGTLDVFVRRGQNGIQPSTCDPDIPCEQPETWFEGSLALIVAGDDEAF